MTTKQNCSFSLNGTSGHRFQNPSRVSFPNHGACLEGVNVLIHKKQGQELGEFDLLSGVEISCGISSRKGGVCFPGEASIHERKRSRGNCVIVILCWYSSNCGFASWNFAV